MEITHSPKFKDYTGRRFGMLTVLAFHSKAKRGLSKWLCRCDCGKEIVAYGTNLTRPNHTTSCGCRQAKITAERSTIHGHAKRTAKSKEFITWCSMIHRTTCQSAGNFEHYGGRGITVCDRWRESFENFLTDMGPKPKGLTLERLNVNGNYEPKNCIWASWLVQARNKRNSRKNRI